MAVLQKVSVYPNERLDVPDFRALEAFSQNDWRYFIQGMLSTKSHVFSGFEITNYQTIFKTRTPAKIKIKNVALIHPEATTQGVGFYVATGSEEDAQISLASDGINYVEVDLNTVSSTMDSRAFWDMGANNGKGGEYTAEVNTVINLDISITSNISGFTDGKIPLYKITNSGGVATKIEDCRPLFYSLASGGSSPDLENRFDWANTPDSAHAKFATPNSITSFNQVEPFSGGDKNIKSLKHWMDAVMSSVAKLKGSTYWYQDSLSLPEAYQNSALTTLVGGTWEHQSGTAGRITLSDGSTVYRLGKANNCTLSEISTPVDLSTNPVLFILLPDDEAAIYQMGEDGVTPVCPKKVSDVTYNTVSVLAGGNYVTSGGKIRIKNVSFSYEGYSEAGGYGTFTEISPDPTGIIQADNEDYVYQDLSGTAAFYHYGSSVQIPGVTSSSSEGAERVMWLAIFDGSSKILLKTGDLEVGEQIQIGDNTSLALLSYIGSTGEADSTPVYDVNSIENGTNLTEAIKQAYQIIETPIYDEVVIDTLSAGYASGTTITLPVNSRASNVAALYTVGTGELLVYENGILLRPKLESESLTEGDYYEDGVSGTLSGTIVLLKDVSPGSTLRFRISSVGGSGTTSGIGIGNSEGAVITNGFYLGTSVFANGTVIDSNGQLGIGTSNPNSPIHIKKSQDTPFYGVNIENPSQSGTSPAAGIEFSAFDGSGSSAHAKVGLTGDTYSDDSIGGNAAFIRNTADGGIAIAAESDLASIRFYTKSGVEEKARITSDGKLGLGTSLPDAYLDVAGSAKFGSASLGFERSFYFASYSVPTATEVSIKLGESATSLSSGWNYRVTLVTSDTTSETASVYILNQTASSSWNAQLVSAIATTGVNPTLSVIGTSVKVSHSGASSQTVSVCVEGYYTANASKTGATLFGLDSAITNLNGNIGIGTSNPTSKLSVSGSLSAGASSVSSLTASGAVSASSATVSGALSAGASSVSSMSVSGALSASSATVSGQIESTANGFKFPDGTIQKSAAASIVADAIVGSSAQKTAGIATHDSINQAITDVAANSKILILKGSYTGDVTVTKSVHIEGQGYGTQITGNWTQQNASDYSCIEKIRISGNITFDSGASGIFFSRVWQGSSGTITDNGSANSKLIIRE